ncbi:MAG TPA: tetratricopeptide repeat protein [Myxococcota bacterium]|nr:tetratricopeptide repeat protein [Myxococcota bacterium]
MIVLLAALAAPPLPDYREEAIVGSWTELNRRITASCTWPDGAAVPAACDPAALDASIAWGRQVIDEVADDGRIHYLIGLAHRYAGRPADAETELREAVKLSPDRAEAWADLGDLLSARGLWGEAAKAFRNVARLRPEGPAAWYAWLQLAQIAANRHDPEGFESALREALRLGFSLRTVAGNPAWRAWWADPAMRPTIERMVGSYAEPAVLDSLRAP